MKISSLLLIGSLLGLGACASRIQTFEDPSGQENHLATLPTYRWAEGTDQATMESLAPTSAHHRYFGEAVRASVHESLEAKGYRPATACQGADFLIDYRIGIHQEVAVADVSGEDPLHDYGVKWTLGKQADVHYEGLSQPLEIPISVQHGTLHIAAFSRDGKLFWHSSAKKVLSERDTDKAKLKMMRQATEKVMAGFPGKK